MFEIILLGLFFAVIKVINLISMGDTGSFNINKNYVFLFVILVGMATQFFFTINNKRVFDFKSIYNNLHLVFDNSNLEPLIGVTAPF